MNEEIKIRIINDIVEMTRLTDDYAAKTSAVLTTDIDETLEEILADIAEINDQLGRYRLDIDEARALCTEQESDLILKMITGGHIPLGISPELRDIHKAAVRLRSGYLAVRDKEKQASARVDARVKELRTELENVTAGRKKMSSYGAGLGGFGRGTGSSFNSKL
ncbi:MAG: hypothetical protein K5876_08150 [Ruminiclostridium sp.]|nr:hypothetical protein [Ruminiclostridium sp.]